MVGKDEIAGTASAAFEPMQPRLTAGEQPGPLRWRHWDRQTGLAAAALGAILLLGAFLRFYQLGSWGVGNAYYAASVQSMLTSWHNFFYASFEPGGSVAVDKPPLGLWLQVASAYFLGVNGFALALPQALAGVVSILLVYILVKPAFGRWAALLAALVLAVMPVTIATERNNTMDGTLVLVLLLAAWAFMKAVRDSRPAWLLLGGFLLGLGFNIKMMQAYMVLPALYLVYFIGAKTSGWKKSAHLLAATLLMLLVSLAWVAAVDLTPAGLRPYVGSSSNNTMSELIIGHNGLKRLGFSDAVLTGADGSFIPPGQAGQFPAPPGSGQFAPAARDGSAGGPPGLPPPPGGFGPGGRGVQDGRGGPGIPGGDEVGMPGLLRLFSALLAEEASWLLPLLLPGILLVAVVAGGKRPLNEKHLALLLWAGWLLPMLLYFSFTSGLWHTYYLIMLGPAIAALTAATAWALWQVFEQRRWIGWTLLALFSGLTLLYQLVTLRAYQGIALPLLALVAAAWLAGLLLLAVKRANKTMATAALLLICLSLLAAPLLISVQTTFNAHPNTALPNAGPDLGRRQPGSTDRNLADSSQALADYLVAHTTAGSYLVATLDSSAAAPLILATKRPVLTFGGFNGSDNVVQVEHLAQMISSGSLRYVLGGEQLTQQKPAIGKWVAENCTPVDWGGLMVDANPQPGGKLQSAVLYDCAGLNSLATP
jgi:4-amino-4-deoxy-L-arabinose transferase-like glycosyltransferase